MLLSKRRIERKRQLVIVVGGIEVVDSVVRRALAAQLLQQHDAIQASLNVPFAQTFTQPQLSGSTMPQPFTQSIAQPQSSVSIMQPAHMAPTMPAPVISTIPPPPVPTVQQSASNMQSVSQRIAGNMNATYMHPAHVPPTHVPPTLAPSPTMPPSDSHNPTIAQMMQQAAERDERMTTLLEHISKSLSEE